MAAPLKAAIPLGIDLDANYKVEFTAISPTDGSLITGVEVSDVSLLVDNLGGGDLTAPGFDATPLWVPLPNNLFSTPEGG